MSQSESTSQSNDPETNPETQHESLQSPNGNGEEQGTLVATLLYGISIPERTARSASAIVGGILNESAARLIPVAFRSSRSYAVFIQQSLDILTHDVGGVVNPDQTNPSEQDSQLAQKAVGGLLDIAGAATLHLSPLTVLAVFSDVAYGSSHYLKLLSEELKKEGVIDQQSSIDRASDLIDALDASSRLASSSLETPPVSLEAMRSTIDKLSDEVLKVDPSKLLPQAEIERLWNGMETIATDTDTRLWDVGTTMTLFAMNRVALTSQGVLSSVNIAGGLFDQHILGHYSEAISEIQEHGLYGILASASQPYAEAAWTHFESDRETWTEELVTGKLFETAWGHVRGWFGD